MVKNPKKAREAMTAAPVKTKCGVVARVMTLGLSVILEEIDSPVARGKKPTKTRELMELFFVMTHPAEVSSSLLTQGRDAFSEAALAWGSGVDMADVLPIATACFEAINRLRSAAGGSAGAEKNAPSAATAGQ